MGAGRLLTNEDIRLYYQSVFDQVSSLLARSIVTIARTLFSGAVA